MCQKTLSLKYSVFIFSALFLAGGYQKSVARASNLASVALWNKSKLVLCFDRKQYHLKDNKVDKYEGIISKAVQRSYTPELTGISFSGFKTCADTDKPDVYFILDDRLEAGFATQVGQYKTSWADLEKLERQALGTLKPAVGMPIQSYLEEASGKNSRVKPDDWIGDVAVHELAHIAGLFHEHAHPKSTCKLVEGEEDESDIYVDRGTPYDPYSLMSYCRDRILTGDGDSEYRDPELDPKKVKIGFSKQDMELLRKIYAKVPK